MRKVAINDDRKRQSKTWPMKEISYSEFLRQYIVADLQAEYFYRCHSESLKNTISACGRMCNSMI